ncbi:MAG: hypothetical protein OXE79_08520 [Acidimicrobiaceae bacterium]|nr:hypothetical protein [Acidimicrobiaceae bacterium]
MRDSAAEVRSLIRVVADGRGLPQSARREAERLLPLVASEPGLVLARLESLRAKVLADLPMRPPASDYARCVSVETFWRFHVDENARGLFRHHVDYQQHLESAKDPSRTARRHLSGAVLVPAPHSWLVPAGRLAGLNGKRLRSLLQFEQTPPYLVMVFPVDRMLAAGVRVREPRGIDAVPKRFTRWAPGDVPEERIDENIPLSALGSLQWRP